jgi:hypothetical protein
MSALFELFAEYGFSPVDVTFLAGRADGQILMQRRRSVGHANAHSNRRRRAAR